VVIGLEDARKEEQEIKDIESAFAKVCNSSTKNKTRIRRKKLVFEEHNTEARNLATR
jgi:hypothetical protein